MSDIPTGSWRSPGSGPAAGTFPTLPRAFGRYELLRALGRGGMGGVFEAKHTVLQRIVALKVPRAGEECSPDVRSLFRREFQIGARLSGLQTLSICQIFDAGEIDGCPFFTMEYPRAHAWHILARRWLPAWITRRGRPQPSSRTGDASRSRADDARRNDHSPRHQAEQHPGHPRAR